MQYLPQGRYCQSGKPCQRHLRKDRNCGADAEREVVPGRGEASASRAARSGAKTQHKIRFTGIDAGEGPGVRRPSSDLRRSYDLLRRRRAARARTQSRRTSERQRPLSIPAHAVFHGFSSTFCSVQARIGAAIRAAVFRALAAPQQLLTARLKNTRRCRPCQFGAPKQAAPPCGQRAFARSNWPARRKSLGLTQRIAPQRPFPADRPSTAVTFTRASASFFRFAASAPGRSSP